MLRQRGATFLLTSAVSAGLESILDRQINSVFSIRFRDNISARDAIEIWKPVVDVLLPCIPQLSAAFTGGNITNKDNVKSAINAFVDMVEATKNANIELFNTLSEKIQSDNS